MQTCRLLQWFHATAAITVSLLSHICGAVTPTCSQSPLQLISPQEADSQIGQWKKMGTGRERGAHSLGHQHTVRIHSAAVNPKSHPPSISIAPGDVHTRTGANVRVLHMSECCTALSSHIPAPPASWESRGCVWNPSTFPYPAGKLQR